MSEARFDSATEQFNQHYNQMRGYVREHVTRENLDQVLGLSKQNPLRVLDMEGGAGRDANWLAAMGHWVVLIDSSAEQLALAYDQPSLGQASIIQGNIDTALNLYGQTGFDLVLSHAALLYQEQPYEYIQKLSQLVRPLGALSLLTAGKFGKINRLQRAGNQAAVEQFILSGTYLNNLNLKARAHLPKELSDMLKSASLETIDWFGVRIQSDEDTRPVDDVPAFHRNRLMGEELRLSRDPAQKAQGQLLHFVAKKLN